MFRYIFSSFLLCCSSSLRDARFEFVVVIEKKKFEFVVVVVVVVVRFQVVLRLRSLQIEK